MRERGAVAQWERVSLAWKRSRVRIPPAPPPFALVASSKPRGQPAEVGRLYVGHARDCAGQRYIGLASDVERRLSAHNADESPHTSKHRPWKCRVVTGFDDERKAAAFEAYLKTGSGWAFAKRHFW